MSRSNMIYTFYFLIFKNLSKIIFFSNFGNFIFHWIQVLPTLIY